MTHRSLAAAAALLALVSAVSGAPRALAAGDATKAVEKAIEFGQPRPVAVSWTELVVDVPVRVKPVGVGGRIERIAFSDLELNGIPFEVDSYTAEFDLPEEEPVELPQPLRLRVKFAKVAPGVLEEALMPSDTLTLRGKVTIGGTFRKWLFSVKRDVDVPLEAKGPNPLAEYHPLKLALAELRDWERRGWRLPF